MLVPVEAGSRGGWLKRPVWALYTLLALNSAVFLAVVFLPSYERILDTYGFTPAHPSALAVVSSMFLHAGFWHVAGNMFFLWTFGDDVEDVLGPGLFVGLYLLSGLGAMAVHYGADPHSTIPCVGASGAISGVLATYIVFFPWRPMDLDLPLNQVWAKTFHTRAVFAGAIWFTEQALLALIWQHTGLAEHGGIAFWAHVGGFFTGALLGLLLRWTGVQERHRKRPWGRTLYLRPGR